MKQRIQYILNPEKTEGMFFCNSLNCFTNAEDAYLNMKYIYTRIIPTTSMKNLYPSRARLA